MSLSPPRLADGTPLTAWSSMRRPVWLFDPTALRGVWANASALELWGAGDLDELLSRDFATLSPAVRARTDRLREVTSHGAQVEERWTFYPNGQPVTVQALISTVALDDGREVLLFEAASTDVGSDERRAVEALRHSSGPVGLFDLAGAPVFANPAAFTVYGEGAPFLDRFGSAEAGRLVLADAAEGRASASVHRMVTRDGPRWHHLDCRPLHDPVTGAIHVLLNERDVTDRVEAEAARSAAEQKAAMAEARQRFLSDMSHELRTPLNAILGFSEILSRNDDDPMRLDYIGHITEAGQALQGVVEQMIDLSQRDDWTGATTDAPSRPAAATQIAPEAVGDGRAMRVLYVEDHAANRALVTALLDAGGIECRTADDGLLGVEAAGAGGWDVILMDIQMPIMDGVEAARRIRAMPGELSRIPIIALTANTLPEQLEAYFAVGMNDCIAKPLRHDDLFERLYTWAATPWRDADAAAA